MIPALTLFRDADVFAPEHVGRRDVLTGGGAILAMEPHLPELALPGCEIVDLKGARLLPR